MSSKRTSTFDIDGVAHASYELQATEDPDAVSEARHFLELHRSIEVWQGARWVVRLEREEPVGVRGIELAGRARSQIT